MKVSLKTLGQIVTGNTPSKSNPEYWHSDDISFVKPDILPDNKVADVWKTKECISEAARSKSRIVGENAIFVTCIGSIGKIGIATKGEFAFNQQINAIIPNSKVFPKYLAYVLLNAKPRLTVMANAPVVPIINKSQFGDFQIDISENYEEQKRISAILDSIESIITQQNQALYLLDKLVKSRFVEMFGEPLKNAKGWIEAPLIEVAPIRQLHGLLQDEVWLLNLDAIESQTGVILFKQRVPVSEINASTVYFTVDSVLYSKLRPYLNKVVMPDENGIATSELLPMYPIPNKLNRTYLCHWLRSDAFVKHISEKVAGAKMPRVAMDYFRSLSIELPPLELQNRFAAFVTEVDKSKLAVQQSLEKLETLKKSLMQQYFG